MTVDEILKQTRTNSKFNHLEDSDSRILLRLVLDQSEAELITNGHRQLNDTEIRQYTDLLEKRNRGIPVAYLTGIREFWSLLLKVNQSVLIPRHETETLVERVLARIEENPARSILELGTGSGAIALAIASECSEVKITATDISADALEIAIVNQQALGIENVSFVTSDWYKNLNGMQFDLICSNPPYIDPNDSHLEQGDLRFEPRDALVAEDAGLAALETIVNQGKAFLSRDGWLIVEHGFEQGRSVRQLFQCAGYMDINTRQDLSGNDRVSEGRIQ